MPGKTWNLCIPSGAATYQFYQHHKQSVPTQVFDIFKRIAFTQVIKSFICIFFAYKSYSKHIKCCFIWINLGCTWCRYLSNQMWKSTAQRNHKYTDLFYDRCFKYLAYSENTLFHFIRCMICIQLVFFILNILK